MVLRDCSAVHYNLGGSLGWLSGISLARPAHWA